MTEPVTAHLIDRTLPEYHEAEVRVRGRVPEWLRGSLVRTAAASFREGSYAAEHLFDAMTALFSFDLEGPSRVLYRQRMLESEMRRRLRAGIQDTPGFYTRMHRKPLTRLLSPVPRGNDNVNVNVLPLDDSLVAMTETYLQHEIDPATLTSKGLVRYDDDQGGKLFMLAHPRFDYARNKVVNVGTMHGRKSGLVVYEHTLGSRTRHIVATLPKTSVPYLHSFGLTERQVVLFAGPLEVESWRLLWSERGYIRHFRYRPERGSSVYRVSRESGEVTRHTAPAMFVFHVINAFERDDTTVIDVLAYDDANIIEWLNTENLRKGWPDFNGRPLRITMRKGREEAEVVPLTDQRLEFPTLHHVQTEARAYNHAWGAFGEQRPTGYEAAIVRLDVERGDVKRFKEPGFGFGEPVFVPSPNAKHEQDGVLLSVAWHLTEPRSALAVLDAETLDVHAWGDLDVAAPLSFHGSFLTARA